MPSTTETKLHHNPYNQSLHRDTLSTKRRGQSQMVHVVHWYTVHSPHQNNTPKTIAESHFPPSSSHHDSTSSSYDLPIPISNSYITPGEGWQQTSTTLSRTTAYSSSLGTASASLPTEKVGSTWNFR